MNRDSGTLILSLTRLLIGPVVLGLLALLSVLPVRSPVSVSLAPDLLLIAVYCWGLRRPQLLAIPVVFVMGMLQDFLGQSLAGTNALILLIVLWSLSGPQRHFLDQSPLVSWSGFFLVGVAAFSMRWLIGAIESSIPVDPWSLASSYLLTVLIYPPIALFLSWIDGFLFDGTEVT